MSCDAFVSLLLTAACSTVFLQTKTLVWSVVTESSHGDTVVQVTDNGAGLLLQGIVNISSGDVERHLLDNDSIIIDVRTAREVDEFGQIPTAHLLPGPTCSIVMIESVSLSVCLRSHMSKLREIFCNACCLQCPWLGLPQAALQYVMYFRFCV